MADESIHKSHRDRVEESFVRLEHQVSNISHNISLLMEALEINIGSFKEVECLNLDIKSYEKSGDNEDP